MDTLHPRSCEIIELARQAGRVDVESLSVQFAVSPQTIRKDLNELCDRALLQRVHGGAVYPTSAVNMAYEARRTVSADAKRRIGELAASLIPNETSLILNIGTTTEQVAQALKRHHGLLVVTNNINVANILRSAPSSEVVIAGGLVRPSDGGIVGEATVDFMRQFKVDYAVIGASAIDRDGTILDYDFREVKVSQAIMAHARQTILVADRLKFERSAPVRIGDLSMIDMLVTDDEPPAGIVEVCAVHGVKLMITTANGVQAA